MSPLKRTAPENMYDMVSQELVSHVESDWLNLTAWLKRLPMLVTWREERGREEECAEDATEREGGRRNQLRTSAPLSSARAAAARA
eukprot:1566871-Rhodomonas_salina.1